jgi:DNA-binding PadR family transcriptional regulator
MHAESNRLILSYIEKQEEKVTLELTRKQAEFIAEAMNWWQTSGVNFWSAQTAEEIEALARGAK